MASAPSDIRGPARAGLPSPPSTFQWAAMAGIAVLAPTLAGCAPRWAQGVVLGLLGLLCLFQPPRDSLGKAVNVLCGALLLLGLAGFLPAAWFGLPEWRVHAAAISLPLPHTLSPQPWLTGEALLLLLGGIAWFYLLWEAQARSLDRSVPMRFFASGIALLAAVSIFFYCARIPWLFPQSVARFGPFPNKNQMGTVLALGSLLSFARIYDAIRFHRRLPWWLLCAGINIGALVLANSRGAIVCFFLGLVAWLIALAGVTRSRLHGSSGLAVLSVLLMAFVLFGGDTINRFHERAKGGEDLSQDLRWAIQKDALDMSLSSPLAGAGLGNFRSVFEFFHRAIGPQDIDIIHPESDWLWLIDEMGWPAFALLFIGGIALLLRALPLDARQPDWHLRAAGLAAGVIFFAHGFVDVAGHRLGSVFPALFAMSFAVPGKAGKLKAEMEWTRSARFFFRLFAFSFLLLPAAAWVWASATGALLPGAVGVALVKQRASGLIDGQKYQEAISLASSALHWAPMDWQLYYDRASAESSLDENAIEAARVDFLRARFLDPTTPELPYDEGLIWMWVRPDLVLQAWADALQRAHDHRLILFQQMMDSLTDSPALLPTLRRLAGDDMDLQLVCIAGAPRQEAVEMIGRILERDPGLVALSDAQRRKLFKLWSDNGDPATVAQRIIGRPAWLPAGWPFAATYLASSGDYRRAYEVTRQFASAPSAPPGLEASSPLDELARRFYTDPSDFAAGVALCERYEQSGDADNALILAEKMTLLPNCPKYLFALQAGLLAARQRWQEAFESLQKSLPQ